MGRGLLGSFVNETYLSRVIQQSHATLKSGKLYWIIPIIACSCQTGYES